jgi:hypothetical protein
MDNEDYRRENQELRDENRRLTEKLQSKEEDVKKYRDQISKLSRRVTANSTQDLYEPSDEKVVEAFRALRDLTQKIVHNRLNIQEDHVRAYSKNARMKEMQTAFFKGWEELSDQTRRYRLRAKIFDILNEELFKKPCFGLAEAVEDSLVNFERSIHLNQGEQSIDGNILSVSLIFIFSPLQINVCK